MLKDERVINGRERTVRGKARTKQIAFSQNQEVLPCPLITSVVNLKTSIDEILRSKSRDNMCPDT